mmetsp:Transcript_696/g.1604  ORF Transcript_696/g.1604 Transcript_696/m.1604 type:complete len:898 (+) Transcript_696:301-2994(+)
MPRSMMGTRRHIILAASFAADSGKGTKGKKKFTSQITKSRSKTSSTTSSDRNHLQDIKMMRFPTSIKGRTRKLKTPSPPAQDNSGTSSPPLTPVTVPETPLSDADKHLLMEQVFNSIESNIENGGMRFLPLVSALPVQNTRQQKPRRTQNLLKDAKGTASLVRDILDESSVNTAEVIEGDLDDDDDDNDDAPPPSPSHSSRDNEQVNEQINENEQEKEETTDRAVVRSLSQAFRDAENVLISFDADELVVDNELNDLSLDEGPEDASSPPPPPPPPRRDADAENGQVLKSGDSSDRSLVRNLSRVFHDAEDVIDAELADIFGSGWDRSSSPTSSGCSSKEDIIGPDCEENEDFDDVPSNQEDEITTIDSVHTMNETSSSAIAERSCKDRQDDRDGKATLFQQNARPFTTTTPSPPHSPKAPASNSSPMPCSINTSAPSSPSHRALVMDVMSNTKIHQRAVNRLKKRYSYLIAKGDTKEAALVANVLALEVERSAFAATACVSPPADGNHTGSDTDTRPCPFTLPESPMHTPVRPRPEEMADVLVNAKASPSQLEAIMRCCSGDDDGSDLFRSPSEEIVFEPLCESSTEAIPSCPSAPVKSRRTASSHALPFIGDLGKGKEKHQGHAPLRLEPRLSPSRSVLDSDLGGLHSINESAPRDESDEDEEERTVLSSVATNSSFSPGSLLRLPPPVTRSPRSSRYYKRSSRTRTKGPGLSSSSADAFESKSSAQSQVLSQFSDFQLRLAKTKQEAVKKNSRRKKEQRMADAIHNAEMMDRFDEIELQTTARNSLDVGQTYESPVSLKEPTSWFFDFDALDTSSFHKLAQGTSVACEDSSGAAGRSISGGARPTWNRLKQNLGLNVPTSVNIDAKLKKLRGGLADIRRYNRGVASEASRESNL